MTALQRMTAASVEGILSFMAKGGLHWSADLLEKSLVFLFQFSLIVLALFILGNFQEFLDRSQDILLQTLIFSSLLGGILSIYWLIYQLVSWFVLKRLYILKLITCVLLLLFNSAILLIFKFFVSWFQI